MLTNELHRSLAPTTPSATRLRIRWAGATTGLLAALCACGDSGAGTTRATEAATTDTTQASTDSTAGTATTGSGPTSDPTTSAPTTTGPTEAVCGDGVVSGSETCDTAIPTGQAGSCVVQCDDGLSCTTDSVSNPGTCNAACVTAEIAECVDGDGCCSDGCDDDTDCITLARIKQTVITDDGAAAWARNGFWDGMKYGNFTPWTGTGLTTLVPELGPMQAHRGIDYVVLPDGKVQMTALPLDGKTAWTRLGSWDGAAYSSWTAWSSQGGDLTAIVPGEPMPQSYRAIDHVVLPDGRLKQTLLTSDGKKVWYRYATWDGSKFAAWTAWDDTYGDLTALIPGQGTAQSFRSYNHFVFVDKKIKVAVLTEDGHTVWHRYADWDGMGYPVWTAWTDQFGNLSALLPNMGTNQAFLAFDEGALAGSGVPGPCMNGCDDADPCTIDACVGNTCQHVLQTCNDNDLCTNDVCVDGVCQNPPLDCEDGNSCTVDSCVNGMCQHGGMNCDDGNPCTDDACDGTCKHTNNTNPCNGGTCGGGQCKPQDCVCTFGCTDSCGQPCNENVQCGQFATCQGGQCLCELDTDYICGGLCCDQNFPCVNGKCIGV